MSCRLSAVMRNAFLSILLAAAMSAAWADSPMPKTTASAIQDNSFLVEEAYNQERGVVQHIFNGIGSVTRLTGQDEKDWAFSFTQEWPIGNQTHQFSYTIPISLISTADEYVHGFTDIALNYRYQALYESESMPAFAPRLSVLVPTGDNDEGLGYGVVGYQVNLPLSKIVADRWTVHGNAGGTYYPGVAGDDPRSVNLGASVVYAVSEDFNLMLEAVGNWQGEPNGSGGSDHSATVLLSPGFRTAINFSNAQMVLGLAVPVGLTSDSPDYGVFLYFSFEHPFLEGVSMR